MRPLLETVTADEPPSWEADPASGAYVRPIGHVEDRPVVRRIADRDLYVGNAHAAVPGRVGRECDRPEFDHVLTVSRDAQPLTTHHRPLVDGADCDWAAFERAVDAARRLSRDSALLVHCRAGISRSSAVAATALAAEEGRRFADALDLVQDARKHAIPHPRLHELGVAYLGAHG